MKKSQTTSQRKAFTGQKVRWKTRKVRILMSNGYWKVIKMRMLG